MSRFAVLFISSVTGAAGLLGAATSAQAQAYVDGGFAELYVGDRVQVYAADGWYEAMVLQVSGGSVLVRYLDPTWSADEWVDIARVSLVGGVQVVGYRPAIQVYWGNQWYDGALLATRGNRYQVRYRGITEWVGPDRWHHRSPYRAPAVGRWNHGGARGYDVGGRHGGGTMRGVRPGGGDRHGQMRGGSRGGGRDHGGRDHGGRPGNGGHRGGGHGRR